MVEQAPAEVLPDPGQQLRARGLRITPQRRAILGAFAGGSAEHLSADEVHARASVAVPELSRGTVYATLAELSGVGVLVALGSPEPVRYEINTAVHQHFRCHLCLRLHDIDAVRASGTDALERAGFVVEQLTVMAEGTCVECVAYEGGLRAGVERMHAAGSSAELPAAVAASEADSPIGRLTLAATVGGLVRLAFEEHADVPGLRVRARSRRGARQARRHLADVETLLDAYFAGDPIRASATIDWPALASVSTSTLRATQEIGYGERRSYDQLGTRAGAHEEGLAIGANPLPIVIPCHRVTRGNHVPPAYTGGHDRKRLLLARERGQRS